MAGELCFRSESRMREDNRQAVEDDNSSERCRANRVGECTEKMLMLWSLRSR